MKAITWNRDSSGLFDYESASYTKSKISVVHDSYIIRLNDKIAAVPLSAQLDIGENTKFLTAITKTTRNFYMNPSLSYSVKEPGFEKSWVAIKYLKTPEYLLSEGDTIRLGKIKLKVKEIHGAKQSEIRKDSVHSKHIQNGGLGSICKQRTEKNCTLSVKCQENFRKDMSACRICLAEDNEPENPLISPCFCAGTMGVIHVLCLQRWLASKFTQNTQNNVKVYSWKALQCELCKFQYPNKISVNGNIVDLMQIERPADNYIVFESFCGELSSLHILSFDGKKQLKLGRGYDTDMRISDISVSRNHAIIKVKSSGLYLEDQSSKFGTLVRLKKKVHLDNDTKIRVQYGKTLLKVSVTRPWSFFGCFTGCSKGKDSDEEIQRFREITQETIPNNGE